MLVKMLKIVDGPLGRTYIISRVNNIMHMHPYVHKYMHTHMYTTTVF